jgi:hypothetical protein
MKKFLSIKKVTTTLGKSDVEIYKSALENTEKRVDFLTVVGEILESTKSAEECEEMKSLLDQMVSILYQKSVIRNTVLGKIHYAEKTYLNESGVTETVEETVENS